MSKGESPKRPPVESVPGLRVEMWPIERPRPYPKNARKWSGQAIEKVANSIREFGWRQPIVCDSQDVVVIGHLRLAAARYLQLKEVPVHVAADLAPAQIKALRIADNRTHEEAAWDKALLGPELIELKISDFNLDFTGFESDEIVASVFGDTKKKRKSAGISSAADPVYQVIVECANELHQSELLSQLQTEGMKCRAVTI